MATLKNSIDVTDISFQQKATEGIWKIKWSIDIVSFSDKQTGQCLTTPIFQAGFGFYQKWTVSVYPKGRNNSNHYYNSYNYSNSTTKKQEDVTVCITYLSSGTINGTFTIAFLDINNAMKNNKSQNYGFSSNSVLYFDKFTNWEYIFNGKNNLLQNNHITLCCELQFKVVQVSVLRYNKEPKLKKLSDDLTKLNKSRKFSDVTILVGNEQFQAHKAILAMRSPVFAKMFKCTSNKLESNLSKITIKNGEPKVIEAFLGYLYSGYCPKIKQMASDLLPIADEYCLELKNMAVKELLVELKVENAVTLLILGDKCNAPNLKAAAIKFINLHGKQVMSSTGWSEIISHPHLIKEIYTAIHDQCIILNKDATII